MNQPSPYQWLFFDADGTLFDFDRAEAHALEQAFIDLQMPFQAEYAPAYQAINRQIWLDFENGQISAEALRVVRFKRLFEELRIQARAVEFSENYLRHLARGTQLIDNAEGVVRRLQEVYQLAIITNGLKDVQRPRLVHSAVADCFAEVAISEELGVAKPDPRFFDMVFERIGNPPHSYVLVIGDSLTSDIQGGYLYGLHTCWFNPTGKPRDPRFIPTYEIQHLEELIPLLIG